MLLTSNVTDGSVPLGLLNYQGIQEMDSVGVLALDDLHNAIGLMLAANVDPARLKWFMRSDVFVHLRKLKDGNERYQLQPDPSAVGGYTLLGIPVTVTNRLPTADGASDVVLADWSCIAVARDLQPSVTILSERYADLDQIAVRVITRFDALPLLEDGILIMRGVTTV